MLSLYRTMENLTKEQRILLNDLTTKIYNTEVKL